MGKVDKQYQNQLNQIQWQVNNEISDRKSGQR